MQNNILIAQEDILSDTLKNAPITSKLIVSEIAF